MKKLTDKKVSQQIKDDFKEQICALIDSDKNFVAKLSAAINQAEGGAVDMNYKVKAKINEMKFKLTSPVLSWKRTPETIEGIDVEIDLDDHPQLNLDDKK